MEDGDRDGIEALFERALVTEDEAFERAETQLRNAGADAMPTLRQHLNHPDPIGQLTARVAIEWAESAEDFDQARRYLAAVARRFARTAAVTPPVRGVVDNLSARFGGRLADLLALHLVKETQAEDWRVLATLEYLDRHKTPAATDALIRFASRTPQRVYQQLAARVLTNSGDPALAEKLTTEGRRLAAQGASLPPALASLAASPGSRA